MIINKKSSGQIFSKYCYNLKKEEQNQCNNILREQIEIIMGY
jgi:hypothetical protein